MAVCGSAFGRRGLSGYPDSHAGGSDPIAPADAPAATRSNAASFASARTDSSPASNSGEPSIAATVIENNGKLQRSMGKTPELPLLHQPRRLTCVLVRNQLRIHRAVGMAFAPL